MRRYLHFSDALHHSLQRGVDLQARAIGVQALEIADPDDNGGKTVPGLQQLLKAAFHFLPVPDACRAIGIHSAAGGVHLTVQGLDLIT